MLASSYGWLSMGPLPQVRRREDKKKMRRQAVRRLAKFLHNDKTIQPG